MWFRRDLRTADLPALRAAADDGAVVPLFVVDPAFLDPAGPNRRRFLAGALRALDRDVGGTLVLRRGDPRLVVPTVAAEVGATTVTVTGDFGPRGAARDRAVAETLAAGGRLLRAVDSPYAVTPGTVRGPSGSPLRVFGAFRRSWAAVGWDRPWPPPSVSFIGGDSDVTIDDIEVGMAEPGRAGLPRWWEGLPLGPADRLPTAGAAMAAARLDRFMAAPILTYAADRDRPGLRGTSGLSPYLRFGCIHPRTVLQRLGTGSGDDRMRDELAWRDFYADVVWHRPESARQSWLPFGHHLRWDSGRRARDLFRAWATGCTGYPLVDAGMRQLLAEGWMHNRVRMVTASFLVKDLHIDWRLGARWFMWHLVDGDLASNQHGWQWVTGTGTDAAPFHRVFNPRLQQERFDPDGTYVNRYLKGPLSSEANPVPVVDHAAERREALARYDDARQMTMTVDS
jgi:deoxyribodipyrimidine photo-lyase